MTSHSLLSEKGSADSVSGAVSGCGGAVDSGVHRIFRPISFVERACLAAIVVWICLANGRHAGAAQPPAAGTGSKPLISQLSVCEPFVFAQPAEDLSDVPASEATDEEASEMPLRLMTFNIRYDNPADGENAWPHRRDEVASIISENQVVVAGLQEALKGQVDDLVERLPHYQWYGVGRADGDEAGEYAPIFYDARRVTLVDQGEFWLSESPETPGSRGWDAACPRITTWVILCDRQSGREFLVANTHFDHRGANARRNSVLLLRQFLAEYDQLPCVLLGDFNCTIQSEAMELLMGDQENGPLEQGEVSRPLQDARSLSQADPVGPGATWNGFEAIAEEGSRIDFVFVSPGIGVQSHQILDQTFNEGHFPSDHLPVMSDLRLLPPTDR